MKLVKKNTTITTGNIAHVDIRNGQYGSFGNLLVIVDDGYMSKPKNPQEQPKYVERNYPVNIKLSDNVIKQAGASGLQVGDLITIEGKTIVEFGKDQQGQVDESKKYQKIEAKSIVEHFPANIAKQLRADIKVEKQNNNQAPQQGQNGYQQPPQNSGGYQQNAGYQQNSGDTNQQPQNNSGGYQRGHSNNNNQPQRNNAPNHYNQ